MLAAGAIVAVVVAILVGLAFRWWFRRSVLRRGGLTNAALREYVEANAATADRRETNGGARYLRYLVPVYDFDGDRARVVLLESSPDRTTATVREVVGAALDGGIRSDLGFATFDRCALGVSEREADDSEIVLALARSLWRRVSGREESMFADVERFARTRADVDDGGSAVTYRFGDGEDAPVLSLRVPPGFRLETDGDGRVVSMPASPCVGLEAGAIASVVAYGDFVQWYLRRFDPYVRVPARGSDEYSTIVVGLAWLCGAEGSALDVISKRSLRGARDFAPTDAAASGDRR